MKRVFLTLAIVLAFASQARAQLTLPFNGTCGVNSGQCLGIINSTGNGNGIFAGGFNGDGLYATSTNGSAVEAHATNGSGIYVTSNNNNAITANSWNTNGQAIAAQNLSSSNAGNVKVIWGWAPNSTNAMGLQMTATFAVVGDGGIIGVWGRSGSGDTGVRGDALGNGEGVMGINTSANGAGVESEGNLVLIQGTFQNQSDARVKHDIQNSPYGLATAMQLRPTTFILNAQPDGGRRIGFIAQDVQKVLPSLVKPVGKDQMLSIAYLELIPVAIKAIQEQQKTIESLEKQVSALQTGHGRVAFGGGYGILALCLLPLGFVIYNRKRA